MSAALALTPKVASRLFLGVERSVGGRPWRDRLDERATTRALAIAQRHNVPELLARILAGRGVEVDEVEAFLDPTVRRLMPDPHTVTAMEEAALRLADAMMRGEQVAIFGDYDVDGATASALLARFLCIGGSEPIVHIPDRIFEGYGPNVEAIRALAERGAKLLVTVDCGTASIEPLAEARRLGLDVIVIDHHQADERLPDAIVINANRLDDLSGLGHLAAVGLVFVTVVAVNRVLRTRGYWTEARPEPDLLGWLDIVALGTVADVVPLKGLNRAFVAKGLLALRRRDNVGLTALMDVARLSGPPEPFHQGFCRPAHQRRRPHRPRRSARCCCAPTIGRGRTHRRRARPSQRRTARHGGRDAGGSAGRGQRRAGHRKGAVVVTAAANWRGVVGLLAARLRPSTARHAIALEPAASARVGPFDSRRRSRQDRAAR
jgi:single-stranded-DNA-specific exonuclease